MNNHQAKMQGRNKYGIRQPGGSRASSEWTSKAIRLSSILCTNNYINLRVISRFQEELILTQKWNKTLKIIEHETRPEYFFESNRTNLIHFSGQSHFSSRNIPRHVLFRQKYI